MYIVAIAVRFGLKIENRFPVRVFRDRPDNKREKEKLSSSDKREAFVV